MKKVLLISFIVISLLVIASCGDDFSDSQFEQWSGDDVRPAIVYIDGHVMTLDEAQALLPEDQRFNVDEDYNPIFEDEPLDNPAE